MNWHPAAELFPLMEGGDFAELVADIAAHGQREPIVMYDGMILDGRNRWRACQQLGLAPVYREWDGVGDPEAFVISLNLHRRHLTREQRAELMRTLRARGMTLQKIADAVGVSHETVRRATSDFTNVNSEIVNERGQSRPAHYAPREVAPELEADDEAPYEAPDDYELNRQQILEANRQGAMIEVPPEKQVYQPMAATVYSHRSVEYYTPVEILEAARTVLGAFDLDPASCAEAQINVKAARFFTQDEDGLAQPWAGRVWLNPPYGKTGGKSNQELWAGRLVNAYRAGDVTDAVLLVKAALGYKWFEELFRDWPVCFVRSRLSFILEGGDDDGQSKQGTALFYFGSNFAKFAATFRTIGRIIPPAAELDATLFG
jgi:phage N-6-adenine-methyltransferase